MNTLSETKTSGICLEKRQSHNYDQEEHFHSKHTECVTLGYITYIYQRQLNLFVRQNNSAKIFLLFSICPKQTPVKYIH